jgi:hypothetical protein
MLCASRFFLSSLNARVQTEEVVKPSANDHVSRTRHLACDIYFFLAPAAQRASTHSSHAMFGISVFLTRFAGCCWCAFLECFQKREAGHDGRATVINNYCFSFRFSFQTKDVRALHCSVMTRAATALMACGDSLTPASDVALNDFE